MYRRLASVLVLLFIMGISASGQQAPREVAHSTNSWFMLMNEFRISTNWYFSNEVHIRRADVYKDWQQFIVRPAINYRINSNVELSAGYSYIRSYPYGEQPLKRMVPEHNTWQQILLRHGIGKLGFMHRYRLEERWIGHVEPNGEGGFQINGSDYANRFRYRLTARFPLITLEDGQRELFAAAFDELWVNLEDNLMVSSFNQNWFYVGLGYQFNAMGNLQAGYMSQVIRKANGVQYEQNPTINIALFYNFDFYTKE